MFFLPISLPTSNCSFVLLSVAVWYHTGGCFDFTNHRITAALLQRDKFEQYNRTFLQTVLGNTLKAYPILNEASKIAACHGAVDLSVLFTGNNIEDVFSETVTLLTILFTAPMTTAGSERRLSTLKRFQTFLRNTVNQERLNALTVLLVEKRLVTDFNQKVVQKFAGQKERRAKAIFIYI